MAEGNRSKNLKLDTQVLMDLWSQDEGIVLKAIMKLRSGGNIHYIPEILKLLNSTGSEPVEKELVRFLSDVKDTAAIPLIVAGLRDRELARARGDIVSACWQSGLDFSQEVDLFVGLFLEGDYRTALESFTVIEESVLNLDQGKIEHARNLVLGGMDKVSEEKMPLARELLNLLQV